MVNAGVLGCEYERPGKLKNAWMPKTTFRRHAYRLTCCSVLIWQILFGGGIECPEEVRVSETSRAECAEKLAEKKIIPGSGALSALSGLVHEIRPGVRVM